MINIPDQTWIVEKFGESQYNIAMEECAELIQAINKHLRLYTAETEQHLIEEIADVMICLEQLQILAEIDEDDLQAMILVKDFRTRKRYGSLGGEYQN